MQIKKFWKNIVRKKDKAWKVDLYFGIEGEKLHSHETISGAMIINGEVSGGVTYYKRINGEILINLDEQGKNLT